MHYLVFTMAAPFLLAFNLTLPLQAPPLQKIPENLSLSKKRYDAGTDEDILAGTSSPPSNIEQLRTSYIDGTPFKHVLVGTLLCDDLS